MAERSLLERIVVSTIFSCLAVFGVVGNILVIFVILRCKRLRTRLNLFIVNIAVSDLLFALLNGPVSAFSVANPGALRGRAICVATGIISVISAFESIFSAVLIAVSRCVRVTRSHRYEELFSRRRCVVLVTLSWVFAFLFTTPMLAGFGKAGFNPINQTCDFDAVESFLYIVSVILPAVTACNVIIVISYVMIYRKVKSSPRPGRGNGEGENIPPAVLSQIKNMVAIYIGFNMCVCPDVIMGLVAYKIGDSLRILSLVARILFSCIPCVNPIIYTVRNTEFRNQLKTLCIAVFKERALQDGENGTSMKTPSGRSPAVTASIPNIQETCL